jgi:putative ABC transport system permease protein
MIQVYYDFSYDRNFKNSNDVYLFSCFWTSDSHREEVSSISESKEMSDKFPEIKNYCLLKNNKNVLFDVRDKDGNVTEITENINKSSLGLLSVFTPEIIIGDARSALTERNKALISESTAHKFFGENNPVGQFIFMHDSITPLTVVAVCKDFPENCTVRNGIFVQIPNEKINDYDYKVYLEVKHEDVTKLVTRLNSKEFDKKNPARSLKDHSKFIAELIPLTKIHLHYPEIGNGNLTGTLSLFAIGLLTLIIAYINFLNFSMAMAPARVRGLNIQKIHGANPLKLKFTIAFEASLFSLLSFLLALLYISFFKESSINEYFPADLSLWNNWTLLSVIGASSILFGAIWGLYPAHYVTSFQPAMALSGSFVLSERSRKLRNTLITIQFISAISLIIISVFIKIQHDYMQNYSWGIQKENIIYLPAKELKTNIKAFGDELKKNPQVVDYTASGSVPGDMSLTWALKDFDGKYVTPVIWPVRSNFLDFFGVKIIEGRNFIETDNSGKPKIIFNQEFLRKYQLKNLVGKEFPFLQNADIVGIAKDINFESLKLPIRPMAFVVLGDSWNEWIFVKIIGKNTPATIEYIRKTWEKYSNESFKPKFLDDSLTNLYRNENNLAKLISIFGLVIIIIAIMGVYGLVVFNARYKSKEIALRKVNGASVKEIMLMLNRSVLIQLAIAFVVAVPLAYYIVHRWLEQFAYKVPIYWWVFILAGLLVLAITVIIVSWQSYKAANANPVEAIKNE